jgi:ABC-2 type transport system permease protein
VQSEVFAFMGPVLLLVYAIGAGARAVAGEEEDGTLDLLLSTPIRRRRVLVDTAAAMIAVTFGLATIVWLAVAVFGPISGLHVPILHLTAAVVDLFGLAVAFGAISLAVGSATGSKHLAVGVAAGLALVTFILNTLAPTVDALKPLRLLSPFHYYSGHSPITTGFTWADPLVLLGIAAVALLVAGTTLERRDLAA